MEFSVKTTKAKDLVDITDKVEELVSECGISEGICLVYVPHATAAIIINEFEPNIKQDFGDVFEKLFPNGNYLHNRIDDNAQAHLKSGFIGPSAVIPVDDGALQLGTWQSIILCEFDGPRERRVIVKVVGK